MNSLGGGSGSVGSLGGIISIGLIIYGLFAGNEKESDKPEEKIELNNYDRTAPIPIIYGTDKVTGTCIYLNNINVDKVTYGGKGFGGPETEAWMYYADFAIGFGEGTIEEYLSYKLGESESNPGGRLSIEEFLGTPDQLKSTLIDLNYNVKNTAYLAFSGCIGTSNILPSITAIIGGTIPINIEETYEMHWDIQDPMCYQFPDGIGNYFTDGNFIYWIDERDGSIYKYNDIDNSKTLIGEAGEFSTAFDNFVTYQSEEEKRTYCFSGLNIINTGSLYGKEFYYNYFYLENGIFYSVKLNEIITCNWEQTEFGLGVISYNKATKRAYVYGNQSSKIGFHGLFFCECNGINVRESFGGSSCYIDFDPIEGYYYINLNFWPTLYDYPDTIQSIYIIDSLTYFGYKLNLPGTTSGYLNHVQIRGIIAVNNILYVYGNCIGSHGRPFIEIFDKDTGTHSNNIFTIYVKPFEYMYVGSTDITATNLGDELVFGIVGRESDKSISFNFAHNFFINGLNISTFTGYFTQVTNGKIILGCVKFNNNWFFMYKKLSITTTATQYLIMYTDDSLGFNGWNSIYGTEIWSDDVNFNGLYWNYSSERNPGSQLCVYNDRLYFKKINMDSGSQYKNYLYLTQSGIIVDENITINSTQYANQFYLISCGQRAVDAIKNSVTYPQETRVLDFKPVVITPIAVLYDFLINSRYGMGISTSLVDGPCNNSNTSFGTEHEYCLEVINTGHIWDYRFLFAKAFTSRQKGYDIIKDILKTCRGFLYFCDGKIKVHIEKPNEEPVIYFGYHKETLVSGPY